MTDEAESPALCAACGAAVTGNFCSACGEEVGEPQRDSIRSFVRDAAVTVASADGRTVRSLRHLLTRPGFLTAEYIAGRRARYLKPLQIFLLSNVLFFVLGAFSGVQILTTPLSSQVCCQSYSLRVVRPLVQERLTGIRAANPVVGSDSTAYAVEVARFAARFNATSEQYARTIVIVLVPMLAVIVAILSRRRGKPLYHLVFSLHFYAFALLLYVGTSITHDVLLRIGVAEISDNQLALFVFVMQTVYLAIAFGRAYGDGVIARVVKGLLASAGTFVLLTLYRLFLFLAAFHAS